VGKNNTQQAVCRNCGFSAFLETFVLVASSGIFSKMVLKICHFSKLQNGWWLLYDHTNNSTE